MRKTKADLRLRSASCLRNLEMIKVDTLLFDKERWCVLIDLYLQSLSGHISHRLNVGYTGEKWYGITWGFIQRLSSETRVWKCTINSQGLRKPSQMTIRNRITCALQESSSKSTKYLIKSQLSLFARFREHKATHPSKYIFVPLTHVPQSLDSISRLPHTTLIQETG